MVYNNIQLDDNVLNDWLKDSNGTAMVMPVFKEKEEQKMALRYPLPELPQGSTSAEPEKRAEDGLFEKMQTVVVPRDGYVPTSAPDTAGPQVYRHVMPPPTIDRTLSDALQALELSAGRCDAAHRHLRSPHLPSDESPGFLSSDSDSDAEMLPDTDLDPALDKHAHAPMIPSSPAASAVGAAGGVGATATQGPIAAGRGRGMVAGLLQEPPGTAGGGPAKGSTGFVRWAPPASAAALDVLERACRTCASPAELASLLDAANRFVFLEARVGAGELRVRGPAGAPTALATTTGVLGDVVQTLAYVAQGTLEDARLERLAAEAEAADPAGCWRFASAGAGTVGAAGAGTGTGAGGTTGWGSLTEEAVPECVATVLGAVRGALGAGPARLPLAAVEVVEEPRLVAGHRDDWVEVGAGWPALWDALQLAPYAQRKDVQCYVLCPDNQAEDARPFFADLCVAYAELCHLGRHALGTDFPGAPDGVVRVPAGLTVDTSRDATNENHLRQYVGKAAALGRHIAEAGLRELRADACVVVYVVDPFTRARDVDAVADVVRSMAEVLRHTRECVCPGARAPVVVEPVPIARVVAYRPDTRAALRDLALGVYAKIRRGTFGPQPDPLAAELPRRTPAPVLAYEPPYVVSAILDSPQTHPQAILVHICYEFSRDRNWIVSTLTDSCGELLQTFVVPNTTASVVPSVVGSEIRANTHGSSSSNGGINKSGNGMGTANDATGGEGDGDGNESGNGNGHNNHNGRNKEPGNVGGGINNSSSNNGSNSGNNGNNKQTSSGTPVGADANTSGDSVEMLDAPVDEDSTGSASAAAAAAPFEACFEQWMGFLETVDAHKGWMLAIAALGVMTGAEYRAWDRVIARRLEGAPRPRVVTLLSLRVAPQWQLLDPARAGPGLRPADAAHDAVSTRTVMAVPDASPVYDLDMCGVAPEAVAIVSSPAPHAAREARWPVAYLVSLLHQYSDSRTKVLAPRVTVQVLARQINALSWLNVLPSAPARCSVLPRHALVTHRLAALCALLPAIVHSIATSDASVTASQASSSASAGTSISSTTSPAPSSVVVVDPPVPSSTPSRF